MSEFERAEKALAKLRRARDALRTLELAAPDLLAALEWIAEDGASDARAVECARAAIAKAKGE